VCQKYTPLILLIKKELNMEKLTIKNTENARCITHLTVEQGNYKQFDKDVKIVPNLCSSPIDLDPGTYTVKCTFTDNNGKTTLTEQSVTIGNECKVQHISIDPAPKMPKLPAKKNP
jgi:uncharacterized protein (DUF2141 family)